MMNVISVLLFSIITLHDPVEVHDSSPLPWFKGEEPATPKNTVLVFVHGKHDDETLWFKDATHYGHNDMYERAYNAGYRTAFVRLGEESSMWYNGRVLAQQIENIEKYYNTRNVVIIAHSKGGIDAQAALVYYNALGAPRKIISLSTPYYGSPLADLVFSNVYTTWLALIIGQATPATFVLQTAYMYRFQNRIADDPDNQYVYYYTLSGWDHGPFPLWLGGAYLALYGGDNEQGGNDGAVTFQSAHVSFPQGHTYRVSLGANEDTEKKWYFNHFNIPLGQNTWQYIDSILELYPVKHLPSIHNTSSLPEYVTIKSTGYIKEGSGSYEFDVKPETRLFVVKTADAQISLGDRKLNFSKLEPYNGIEYADMKTSSHSKIHANGRFFIIGEENREPVSVTYSPLVINTLPKIKIATKGSKNIDYTIFIKEYTLNGEFVRDIHLKGEMESGSNILLPLYEDALYNIHLKAFYSGSERDLVFSLIKETNFDGEQTKANSKTVISRIERVENMNSLTPNRFDILGRKVPFMKSGIYFNSHGKEKNVKILLK